MIKTKRLIILVLMVLWYASAGFADTGIYKHTDGQGRITYLNQSVKGGEKLSTVTASLKPGSNKVRKGAFRFPKVDRKTQNQRDSMRRQILENELAAEIKLLSYERKVLSKVYANAKKTKKSISQSDLYQAKYQAKVKLIQNKVRLHERNIAALKKELANL